MNLFYCRKTMPPKMPINGFTQKETGSLIEAEIGKAEAWNCLHKILNELSKKGHKIEENILSLVSSEIHSMCVSNLYFPKLTDYIVSSFGFFYSLIIFSR
jgi:hypothetical protein